MEITTQDIRALRHADSLCFDMHADGTGAIRAIVRGDRSSTGFDETHSVQVTARLENYGRGDGPFVGFHMEMHSRNNDATQTILRHLRAGMEVHLIWTRDNSCELYRDAGLVCDELRMRIGKRDGKTADTFRIERAVRRDNSARMIRKGDKR